MKKAQRILKEKLNTSSLIVILPDYNQWHPALQRFVYLVTEICHYRGVDFAICAPNMRVSSRNLRPSWLSHMWFIASVSKTVQSVETSGNSQLTLDDAIYFDHGTRMALLMFSAEGQPRNAKQSECITGWSVRAPLERKRQKKLN